MRNVLVLSLTLSLTVACGDDELTDEEAVRLIYDNFQPTIDKIIEQGLLAKSASTSGANITPFSVAGDEEGTMTVGGQIAQSSGENQNFNLWVQLEGPYSDTGDVGYVTDNTDNTTKLQFDLQITNQPTDNSMDGSIDGALRVSGGDVDGAATFALAFATDLSDDDGNPAVICSHVQGTVSQGTQTETIDFVLPEDTTGLDQAQIDKCNGLTP